MNPKPEKSKKDDKGKKERILFIEDDSNIRASTKLFLQKRNLILDEAETGQEGLDMFSEEKHQLVLLDLMLPDMYGLEICRQLRTHSTVPIIILTAKDDTHEVVEGLSSGADDYITKPFEPQELAARIDAMLRRVRYCKEADKMLPVKAKHGELEVLPQEGRVFRDGREIMLTRTETTLFMELYKNKGKPVTRDHLSSVIWVDKPCSTNRLVDIQVSRLRLKLEVDVTTPRYIRTVRRVGYKFEP